MVPCLWWTVHVFGTELIRNLAIWLAESQDYDLSIYKVYLYYNYEKYPQSPLKPRFLVLIEQYLPNISDSVYSVHQSFMWFLWLNWRKSTFYPVTAPNDSKCWPIVTSSIQEPAASNCDVTVADCSRVVAIDAFLAQWNRKFITAQWSTENTSCFNFFVCLFIFQFCDPRVQHKFNFISPRMALLFQHD